METTNQNQKTSQPFGGKILRRTLIVIAWAVTILALFYAEENWRGRRAWNNYRTQLEAKGEQLDLNTFIPKPIADEQNFAATPFVKSWFQRKTDPTNGSSAFTFEWKDNFSSASEMVVVKSSNKTNKVGRVFTDLVGWKKALDAVNAGETNSKHEFPYEQRSRTSREEVATPVLAGMKPSMTGIEELRAVSHRPYSQYPLVYDMKNPWGILLPHLVRVKQVCQRLSIHACAELAAGQSDNALADLKLIFRMMDSIKDEPMLISYLVRLACVQVAIQPVWEGLAEHRWSDEQLQELQTQFQSYNFFRDLKQPMDGERAMGILTGELIRKDKKILNFLTDINSDSNKSPSWLLFAQAAPSGWFYLEQLNYLRLFQGQLNGAYDAEQKRISISTIMDNQKTVQEELSGGHFGKTIGAIIHHRTIASVMLPALEKLPYKAADTQLAVDEAALACGLERFHLATGQFPEKLEALTPKFVSVIPDDVYNGESYKYERTSDGQFILYSAGRVEKDDGGRLGRTLYDDKHGNYVWQYPENRQN